MRLPLLIFVYLVFTALCYHQYAHGNLFIPTGMNITLSAKFAFYFFFLCGYLDPVSGFIRVSVSILTTITALIGVQLNSFEETTNWGRNSTLWVRGAV